MRHSIRWTVLTVWALTAVAVIGMANVRRPTPVKLVVQVRLTLSTTATSLLDPLNADEFGVTNIDSLRISGSDRPAIELRGDELASCTFSNVRLER